jgi:hypothetical protein
MIPSLILVMVWLLAANVLATIPSSDNHWTRQDLLIVLGIPLLGYVTRENGPWIGLLVLTAGMSVLRWPIRDLGHWILLRIGHRGT